MSQPSQSGIQPAQALDLTGRTLADFRVLRKLGQGGMGQVYLAEQVSLKRKVALKILRPELAESPEALQRFKAEAEAVARATHANIVQVYAFGEAEGMPYMALEYVEGRNLREYLSRKSPDVLVALSIMRQVAAGLQRASELGIIHRDIKPENILLTRKGEVKVADFGLSRCLAGDRPALNLTQSGVTMGTPLYMSPEQVEGKPVDPRTDIYSFGVTCYHMLAGQPPFRGENAFQVALRHVRTPPTPLASIRPDLPEALCAIVHKMMAKDPAQRYQTGRELLRDVLRVRESLSGQTALLAGPPTVAVERLPLAGVTPLQSPKVPTQPIPAPRRGSWWIGLGVLAVFLAAGGGALFAWNERRRAGPLPAAGVAPADASTVEAICLPQKKERALREAAEQYLGATDKKNAKTLATGFLLCLDLGLFYLEEDRLDDAERLFKRLQGRRDLPSYRLLGQLGEGIVLALRNEPKESNKLFREAVHSVFPGPRKGKDRRPTPLGAALRGLFDNPQWRYWMTKARWYNARNHLAESDVPHWLKNNAPLTPGRPGAAGKRG
jgi:serine/threonine-protein kinase